MSWNHIKRVEPKKTAVLVIDMENNFVTEGGTMFTEMGNKILPSMAAFLEQCRKVEMKIIFTAWNTDDINRMVSPRDNEVVIKKHGYSAFCKTELDQILKENGVEVVAVIGVMTDCCCLASAFDAHSLGYKVAFISDLTGTRAYPDLGFGPGDAELQQKVTLGSIAYSTGHVLLASEFLALVD